MRQNISGIRDLNDLKVLKAPNVLNAFSLPLLPFASLLDSHARHLLAETAFAQEPFAQPVYLFVKQIIGLFYQNYRHVGYRFVAARRYKFAIERRIVMAASEFAHLCHLDGIIFPLPQPAGTQIVFVIDSSSCKLAFATLSSFIYVSDDVGDTAQPSAIFCLPERAACTIWSVVRSPFCRKRRQKLNVMSYIASDFW